MRLDLLSLISIFSPTSMKRGGSHRPQRPPPASFISLAQLRLSHSFFLTVSCTSVSSQPCPPPPHHPHLTCLCSVCVHLFSCSGDTSDTSSARSPVVFFPLFGTQSLSEGAIGALGQDTSSDWLSTVQNTIR